MTVEPTSLGEDTRLDILSLEHADNDTTILKFQVTNDRDEEVSIHSPLSDGNGDSLSVSGFALVDVEAKKQYLPIRYEKDKTHRPRPCYCSMYEEFGDPKRIEPGQTMDFWAGYPALPDGVDTVSVVNPITGVVHDIPVTDGGAPPEPLRDDHLEPEVVDLFAVREDLEDGSTREETGEQVSVALASDVLFDVDKATLRSDAEKALKEVAEEISASGTDLVKIDGHTDNTGSDSHNLPLSETRAETVQDKLDELVTRSGIRYETEGHGSREPVADNTTDEGKQKNRRVTITFDAAPATDEKASAGDQQSSPTPEAESVEHGPAPIAEGKETRYFKDLTVAVESVQRSSSGGFTGLRYRVINHANEDSTVLAGRFNSYVHCGSMRDGQLNDIALVDEQDQTRYTVVRRSDEKCLASKGSGVTVPPNESLTLWLAFWLDPTVNEVTVQIPGFEAITNVPVA
ncbi:OmpA family protein [Nocardiopsis rhodophaea]